MRLRSNIIGDANVILKLIDDLRDAAQESIEDSVKILGEMVKAEAKKAIVNQTPNWKPLNPRYVKYKTSRGYPSKIYLFTKSLYTSINTEVVRKGTANIAVKVGFPRTHHPATGVKISEIARRMEFGVATKKNKLPPRPLLSYATPIAHKKFMAKKVYLPSVLFYDKARKLVARARARTGIY